jgi:hypothetical protein
VIVEILGYVMPVLGFVGAAGLLLLPVLFLHEMYGGPAYRVVRQGYVFYIAKRSGAFVENIFYNPVTFDSKEEAEAFIRDRLTWHEV